MKKELVYVAHPYGGLEYNKKACEDKIQKLAELFYDSHVFVSPVLNFGHMYKDYQYVAGIDICLSLLERCDTLLLSGNWISSKGCMAEYAFAKAKGIRIKHEKEFGL